MKISKRMSMALGIAGALWLASAAPGCAPSTASYCNKVCDCSACSDAKLDECVESLGQQRKVAQGASCAAEFDAVLSCAHAELTCNNGQPIQAPCQSENEALGKCSNGTAGFGNLCDLAVAVYIAHYEECTGLDTGDPGSSGSCPAAEGKAAQCAAACYTATSCNFVNGTGTNQENQAYSDCVTNCY